MIIIGISGEHDAGVTVVEDGRIVFAVNEERLNRRKFHRGFPELSFDSALRYLNENGAMGKIGGCALASEITVDEMGIPGKPTVPQRCFGLLSEVGIAPLILGTSCGVAAGNFVMRQMQFQRRSRIRRMLGERGLDHVPFKIYDHHYCHATSAYYTSGYDRCLSISVDAAGDGYCSRAYACDGGSMELLHSIPFYHSIGYYYTLVTLIAGFKFGQEGKITGLSARGDAEKVIKIFRDKIFYNPKRMIFENRGRFYLSEYDRLAALLKGYSLEDVSAGIQEHFESLITSYIGDLIKKRGGSASLALSGGCFANVLLNRKVCRVKGVEKVFIHPNMGDGGLATGAAFALCRELDKDVRPYTLEDVYLGPDITDEHIRKAVVVSGFAYRRLDDIEEEIAKLLVKGKVVARFEGRMEYGPRALGHRSIIYQPTEASVKTWLNKRLARSEFMPFAPSVLEEDMDDYFIFEGQYRPGYFMTIVSNVTPKCRTLCPAIVHVDGTARPQIVSKRISPSYHKILSAYKKLTGISVIVNTSFNMHEEPIVNSPESALDAFSRGHLDYLAIGNYLVEGTSQQ